MTPLLDREGKPVITAVYDRRSWPRLRGTQTLCASLKFFCQHFVGRLNLIGNDVLRQLRQQPCRPSAEKTRDILHCLPLGALRLRIAVSHGNDTDHSLRVRNLQNRFQTARIPDSHNQSGEPQLGGFEKQSGAEKTKKIHSSLPDDDPIAALSVDQQLLAHVWAGDRL